MKKLFITLLVVLSFSCDDGDFEIASFEFDETINKCGEFTLYRYGLDGKKEVLMLTLTDKEIKNSDEIVLPVSISPNSDYTVTYRIFESEVDANYFCATVPPYEPKTAKNYDGASGKILVENKPVLDEDNNIIAYTHTIVINDLVLQSGEETLNFDQNYLFGTFETAVSN